MEDLIYSQISSLEQSMKPTESNILLSYQQYNQQQMITTFGKYFHNLKQHYKRNAQSKVNKKLLSQYNLLGNSLWSYAQDIHQFISTLTTTQENHSLCIALEHFHYLSQSPFLAVYFKGCGYRVRLIGSVGSIGKGWSQSVVQFGQVDQVSGFKNLMVSQQIDVSYYENGYEDQIQNIDSQKQRLNITIIDIFNTHQSIYKPYLLSLPKWQSRTTFIFHYHPSQSQQLHKLIPQLSPINIGTSTSTSQIHEIKLHNKFPYQSSSILDNKFQEQLFSFLNQQLNHPNKQDILIFHQPDELFVKRVRNLLKKDGAELGKHVKIISKANQNRSDSLPPPPSFLTQLISSSTLQKQEKSQSSVSNSQIKSQSSEIKEGSQSTLKKAASSTGSISKNSHTFNNIIIAPNFDTLMNWHYDLSHVYYVFDFRSDQAFYFDYEMMTYVESFQDFVTNREALLRASCIGTNKIGKYCYVMADGEQGERISNSFISQLADHRIKDIGPYCLQMINGGYIKQLTKQAAECKDARLCLKALQEAKIIKKTEDTIEIIRKDVYQCITKIKQMNPILCAAIIKAKKGELQHQIAPAKMAILMAMATGIMMTPGNLRQISNSTNSVSNRPTQIWRQTGYLHSSIDVLVRAKIIQHREHLQRQGKKSKKSVSRRISKQTSQQFNIFGDLFQIVTADRITFDQMKLEDLLREEIINQIIFNAIVDVTQKISDALQLDDFVFTSFEDINAVLADLIQPLSQAIGIYSGSRRIGYLVRNQQDGVFPNKSSLLAVLNERPSFIYMTRLMKTLSLDSTPKIQILMGNSVPQMTIMQSIGTLPTRKTNSYGQTQIQFYGISSATFKCLWRNNGADIISFEDKFGCFVEPNEQVASISIHCPKQKEKIVKAEFQNVLLKVKQKMATQTKISHYLGATSLLFSSGGRVIQVIKDKYINKCALSNLDLSVEVEDLQELFQQFFHLKDIKLMREPPSASFKTAYIEFQTQKDYYRFYQYYNECLYLGRYLRVAPIQSIPAESTYKQKMYLECIWNAWKSNHESIVQFETQEACLKCVEDLKALKIDGKILKTQLRANNRVYLVGLSALTDQVDLEGFMQVYGKVKSVQILKTPMKQKLNSLQANLQQQIRKAAPGALQIEIKNIEKMKNGLRKCRVQFKVEAKLNQVFIALDTKVGIMGVGRIHLKTWFEYPVKIVHTYLNLYEQLVQKCLQKIPNNQIKIQNKIFNDQEYIVAKSNKKQQIDLFKKNINEELQGYPIPLTGLQASILLTEVGIRNLIDMEEKYVCRLIPDFNKKELKVLALFNDVRIIRQQIKAKVQDNFFYRISLNQRSFKHFKQNPELCENLKKQYHLSQFELEEVGRNLLLEGGANNVQKIFNYLMHLIESVSRPEEQMINADVCGICCEQPFRPYRLQQCGHKFCINCLLDSLNCSLNDISMFPLKCPQCLVEVAIVDLDELIVPEVWPKLRDISLNQFVGRNTQIISNCYTAGCKQVNFLIKTHFNCDECNQTYCIGCKLNYHPGLTCQEAKQGGNAAFQKYMKENGIRKCPNASCKMPIMRTDGCYRVTCSRCNKSMCFKCEPEKMIAYDHYNDCYKHLTEAHGGYW